MFNVVLLEWRGDKGRREEEKGVGREGGKGWMEVRMDGLWRICKRYINRWTGVP